MQPDDLRELEPLLAGEGLTVERVQSLAEVRRAMASHGADVIVARVCACYSEPLTLLDEQLPAPVLLVTPGADMPLYLEAMRRGAFDCVGLPLDEGEFLRLIRRALDSSRARVTAGGTP
jgi:DNA-binding NtrC family response regulator